MSVIYINDEDPGVEITDVGWVHADLHGSAGTGRSENTGVMNIDKIGEARTLRVGVGQGTGVEAMSRLLKMIRPGTKSMFWVTFFDALEGGWLRREFYSGDISVSFLEWPEGLTPGVSTDFSGITYGAFTLDFVEKGKSVEKEE